LELAKPGRFKGAAEEVKLGFLSMSERMVQCEKCSASETGRDTQRRFEFHSADTNELLCTLEVVRGGFRAVDFLDGHSSGNRLRLGELQGGAAENLKLKRVEKPWPVSHVLWENGRINGLTDSPGIPEMPALHVDLDLYARVRFHPASGRLTR
jgi:hypothetical protein